MLFTVYVFLHIAKIRQQTVLNYLFCFKLYDKCYICKSLKISVYCYENRDDSIERSINGNLTRTVLQPVKLELHKVPRLSADAKKLGSTTPFVIKKAKHTLLVKPNGRRSDITRSTLPSTVSVRTMP